jgi:hypothetical protein
LPTTFETLSAFELEVLGDSINIEGAMMLHVSESFCCAGKLKGLMISASFERLGRAVARALIYPGQDTGAVLFFPVLIRSSRQFFEVLRDGLFEFGGEAADIRGLSSGNREAEVLRCSVRSGAVAVVVPYRPKEVEEVRRNRAEVRHPMRRRVWLQQLCFCDPEKAAALEAHSAAVGQHLQQARQGQEKWRSRSQRTSDRSTERSQLRPVIVH